MDEERGGEEKRQRKLKELMRFFWGGGVGRGGVCGNSQLCLAEKKLRLEVQKLSTVEITVLSETFQKPVSCTVFHTVHSVRKMLFSGTAAVFNILPNLDLRLLDRTNKLLCHFFFVTKTIGRNVNLIKT